MGSAAHPRRTDTKSDRRMDCTPALRTALLQMVVAQYARASLRNFFISCWRGWAEMAIARITPSRMVTQERAPSLAWRPPSLGHVFRHRRLHDVKAALSSVLALEVALVLEDGRKLTRSCGR